MMTQAVPIPPLPDRVAPRAANAMPTGWARVLMLSAIVAVGIGIDQATKVYANQVLRHTPPKSYFGDTFRIDYERNRGAFLSLGAGWSDELRFGVLTVANAVVLIGLGVYLLVSSELTTWVWTALAYIVAGGLGNLIDRVIYRGEVVDFLNLGIGNLRTGVFNVADMFITAGALMILLQFLWQWEDPPRREPAGGEPLPAATSAEQSPS